MNTRTLATPIAMLLAEYDHRRITAIGEPYATDLEAAAAFAPLLHHALRVEEDNAGGMSVRWFAHQILTQLADLFQAPQGGYQGAVCGNLATATARTLLPLRHANPDLVLYRSATAHPYVAEAAHLLGLETVIVPTDRRGHLNLDQLASAVRVNGSRAAVVVVTWGDPVTGAMDEVPAVNAALDPVTAHRHTHVDAPLEGLALAARAALAQVPFGFRDGADSVVVAGDQFPGAALHCAVTVSRTAGAVPSAATAAGDLETVDPGSGHATVLLWRALHEFGIDGLARRARRSHALAGYTVRRLLDLGWPAGRDPDAMTVLLRPPSEALRKRWSLPVHGGWARIVCVPGVTEAHIDQFVAELVHEVPVASTGAGSSEAPQPAPDAYAPPAAGRGPVPPA